MKANGLDPRCFDVAAAAKQGDSVEGTTPLATMRRLLESAHESAPPDADDSVRWQARSESRAVRGAAPQIWLHLGADTEVSLVCQRCLQPLLTALRAQRSFRFVAGEAEAAKLDADSEDDVLALSRTIDLLELAEDELLLNLPLVPRHDTCPQPLLVADDKSVELADRPNPFAALSVLKRSGLPS